MFSLIIKKTNFKHEHEQNMNIVHINIYIYMMRLSGKEKITHKANYFRHCTCYQFRY